MNLYNYHSIQLRVRPVFFLSWLTDVFCHFVAPQGGGKEDDELDRTMPGQESHGFLDIC